MSQLHSYKVLSDALKKAQLPYTPAELHGLVSGMLAAARPLSDAVVLARLASHVGAERWPAALIGDWKLLRDAILTGYQDAAMSFDLLLPDASSLTDRAIAVAAWCEGFMAGFGEVAVGGKLPALVNEALADLMAISRMEIPDEAEGKDGEEADLLVQVEEHCRIVAVAVFTEMALVERKPKAAATHKEGV